MGPRARPWPALALLAALATPSWAQAVTDSTTRLAPAPIDARLRTGAASGDTGRIYPRTYWAEGGLSGGIVLGTIAGMLAAGLCSYSESGDDCTLAPVTGFLVGAAVGFPVGALIGGGDPEAAGGFGGPGGSRWRREPDGAPDPQLGPDAGRDGDGGRRGRLGAVDVRRGSVGSRHGAARRAGVSLIPPPGRGQNGQVISQYQFSDTGVGRPRSRIPHFPTSVLNITYLIRRSQCRPCTGAAPSLAPSPDRRKGPGLRVRGLRSSASSRSGRRSS